jgi:hypothetical protein
MPVEERVGGRWRECRALRGAPSGMARYAQGVGAAHYLALPCSLSCPLLLLLLLVCCCCLCESLSVVIFRRRCPACHTRSAFHTQQHPNRHVTADEAKPRQDMRLDVSHPSSCMLLACWECGAVGSNRAVCLPKANMTRRGRLWLVHHPQLPSRPVVPGSRCPLYAGQAARGPLCTAVGQKQVSPACGGCFG